MPMELDERTSLYDREPMNLDKPCCAPLNEVCIAATADIILCCLDWKGMHTFGNLTDHDFMELINGKEISKVFEQLRCGNRILHMCERCDWSR